MKPGSYIYLSEESAAEYVAKGFKPVSLSEEGKRLYYRPFKWVEENRFHWERENADGALHIYDRRRGFGCNYNPSRPVAITWDPDLANAICEALNEREFA